MTSLNERNKIAAKNIAKATEDAYMAKEYGTDFERCAFFLLEKNFSENEVEMILRSKHMRWAGENFEDFSTYFKSQEKNIFLDATRWTYENLCEKLKITGCYDISAEFLESYLKDALNNVLQLPDKSKSNKKRREIESDVYECFKLALYLNVDNRYEVSKLNLDKIYSLAYAYGHSSGMSEIESYFDDLVNLVNSCLPKPVATHALNENDNENDVHYMPNAWEGS